MTTVQKGLCVKSSVCSDTAAVVVNYNGWEDTVRCVASLLLGDPVPALILIIDNGSTDDSFTHLRQWGTERTIPPLAESHPIYRHVPLKKSLPAFIFHAETSAPVETAQLPDNQPTVQIIHQAKNRGFAAGANLGLSRAFAHAAIQWVWILNHDTVVAPDALAALRRCTAEQSQHLLWGSKLLDFDQPEVIQAVGGHYRPCLGLPTHIGQGEADRGQYDRPVAMDYPVGAALFVHRHFVEAVGALDEGYFLYFEELDWVTRARRKGLTFGYCWQSRVFHREGSATGGKIVRQKSELSDFYLVRNRLIFTRRYYPWCLPLVYVSFIGVLLRRIVRGQWRRIPKILKILVTHRV